MHAIRAMARPYCVLYSISPDLHGQKRSKNVPDQSLCDFAHGPARIILLAVSEIALQPHWPAIRLLWHDIQSHALLAYATRLAAVLPVRGSGRCMKYDVEAKSSGFP